MVNQILIILGKLVGYASKLLNLGHGSTWPGHIALSINKKFISKLIKANPHLKIIIIAGTNGKTTTCKLIQTILEKANYRAFQNESGANLLNGIASSMLLRSNILCKLNYDYAIFEVDENTLPQALNQVDADYLVLLNLFRDQLDRYGEVNTIAKKWQKAIGDLPNKTTLILNADDPLITYLGRKIKPKVFYYGLGAWRLCLTKAQHATDSTYCLLCSSKLIFDALSYSHLGIWRCNQCGYKRPTPSLSFAPFYPLVGIYNKYNALAATLLAKEIGISLKNIKFALKSFQAAFGRQESLKVKDKKIQIFLSKNPASFNESLRTIKGLDAEKILLVLNDRIPDGRDVSWIWDVDFEDYIDVFKNITVSGDRAYDMALRIKYLDSAKRGAAGKTQNYISKVKIYENLNDAIKESLKKLALSETLYILPTYSAMLEVRKILLGKQIL